MFWEPIAALGLKRCGCTATILSEACSEAGLAQHPDAESGGELLCSALRMDVESMGCRVLPLSVALSLASRDALQLRPPERVEFSN